MSRAKRNVASSTDDAMVYQYDIYYVHMAVEKLRNLPVDDLADNLDKLDAKIRILAEHIEASFGKLARELPPR